MHARTTRARAHTQMHVRTRMHARTHARTQEVVFVDADEDSGLVAIQERAAEACSLPEVTSKGPGARMQVRRSARAQAREARQLTAAVPGCSQMWVFLRDLNPQALAQVVADQLGGTFDAEDTMRHFWEKESEREKLKSKWVGYQGGRRAQRWGAQGAGAAQRPARPPDAAPSLHPRRPSYPPPRLPGSRTAVPACTRNGDHGGGSARCPAPPPTPLRPRHCPPLTARCTPAPLPPAPGAGRWSSTWRTCKWG